MLSIDLPTEGYASIKYTVNGEDIDGTTFTVGEEDVTVAFNSQPTSWSGDGTENVPYVIRYPSQLDLLAQRVNSATGDDDAASGYSGKYFVLGADITYSHTTYWDDVDSEENNYTAIGSSHSFCGHFDGRGHTVSGIRIYKRGNKPTDNPYQGLFGRIFNADIRGITLTDSRISGWQYIGGIVGYNSRGTISDCHVAANVSRAMPVTTAASRATTPAAPSATAPAQPSSPDQRAAAATTMAAS